MHAGSEESLSWVEIRIESEYDVIATVALPSTLPKKPIVVSVPFGQVGKAHSHHKRTTCRALAVKCILRTEITNRFH